MEKMNNDGETLNRKNALAPLSIRVSESIFHLFTNCRSYHIIFDCYDAFVENTAHQIESNNYNDSDAEKKRSLFRTHRGSLTHFSVEFLLKSLFFFLQKPPQSVYLHFGSHSFL